MDTDRIIQKYIILLGQQTHNNIVLETEKEHLLMENENLRKELKEIKGEKEEVNKDRKQDKSK